MKLRIRALLLAAMFVVSLLPVMSMAAATTVATEGELTAALANGGEIVLGDNIVLTAGVVVASDKTVTLELNGKTLSLQDATGATAALIKNNGTLTIQDSSAAGTGKISFKTTTPSATNGYASNAVSNYGTLTMKSGTIENLSVGGGACYAIDSYAGSTTNIQGGKMTAVKTTVRIFNWSNGDAAAAVMNISGGEIISEDGYGVNLNMGNAPQVTVNISGGTITTNDTDYNLGVYVVSKGSAENVELKVSGGTINGAFALNSITSTTMGADNVAITGGTMDTVICYDAPAYKFVTGGSFPKAEESELADVIVPGSENNVQIGPPPAYAGPVMNWVKVNTADNGVVKSGPLAASAGATVTLYPKAAAGYVLDTVEVLDAEGNAVELDGLKFAIPAGGVTVNATFKLAE